MKLYYTIVALIITYNFSYGQTDKSSIKLYYDYINQAELNIVDSNYIAARQFYNKAFELKYPNGKDLYNSFLIAYYLSDSILAKRQFNELSYQGLSKFAIIDTAFNYEFFKYATSEYDSFYDVGIQKRSQYTSILDSIFRLDQAVRSKSWLSEEEEYKEMTTIDSNNLVLMKNYINVNGFPSFEQIGFEHWSPMNEGTLWYLLWHNRPFETEIDSLVLKAVMEGDYSPEVWASIIMVRHNADSFGYHMNVWERTPELSKEEIKAMNERRAAIYLEPIEDYQKKWLYMKRSLEQGATKFGNDGSNLKPTFIFYQSMLLRDEG